MACFFALENVLPAGDLFFVKKESDDFWKPFRSVNTNCFYISVTNAIPFYDKICNWKTSFRLSWYNVIHYKITPAPNFATLNDVYRACQANMEDFLFAISGGNPITVIPYIDQIVEALDDKYYVIVKIGDIFQRHFRHKDTAIRLHEYHEDIDELYDYVEQNFRCYGKIDFTIDSCIVWIKECWRGSNVTDAEIDPNLLLKNIVAEVYWENDSLHMLQSINGSIASINSTHKTASREELYHLAKLRFETDPQYEDFVAHRAFEKYISAKTAIIELQDQLSAQHHDAEIGCLDYKVIKALAATYELQDYLAARIASECPDESINIPIDELMKLSTEELEYIIQMDLDYEDYDSETIENVTNILMRRSGVSENTRKANADAAWERFKDANPQIFG